MDRLAREAAAALAEGLTYGQWKAKHPEGLPDPPGKTTAPPGYKQLPTRACAYCGKIFYLTHRNRKHCCDLCRHRKATEKFNKRKAERLAATAATT
jgi:hypothetical protein